MSLSSAAALMLAVVVAVAAAAYVRPAQSQQLSGDALVVSQLRKAGSDLSKVHELEFFLYFPSEPGAAHVAAELNRIGFEAVVRPAAGGGLPWQVLAKRSMIPVVAELERLRAVLSGMSEKEHGEYDGWGTPVVR